MFIVHTMYVSFTEYAYLVQDYTYLIRTRHDGFTDYSRLVHILRIFILHNTYI